MTTNDGGPAFPGEETVTVWDSGKTSNVSIGKGSMTFEGDAPWLQNKKYQGMSLRDWFAGMALSALMPDFVPGTTPHHNAYWDNVARDAFKCADAMLRARDGA